MPTASEVRRIIHAGASAALGANTRYLFDTYGVAPSATVVPVAVVTRAGAIAQLQVCAQTAPGGSDTVITTVQKSSDNGASWSNTTLTCTITGAAKSASDVAHTVTVAAGDLLAVKVVSSAATAAGIVVGFEEQNT